MLVPKIDAATIQIWPLLIAHNNVYALIFPFDCELTYSCAAIIRGAASKYSIVNNQLSPVFQLKWHNFVSEQPTPHKRNFEAVAEVIRKWCQ